MPGIARGSLLNLVGAGVSAVAGIALVVLVTRTFAQSTAGLFFTLTSLFLLAQVVAGLGTGTGLVYFTSRLRSLGRSDEIRAFQTVALVPVAVLAALGAAALVAVSSAVADVAGGSAEARTTVVVLAALLPLAVLSDSLLAATRGHATMLPTVALERVLRPLLQLSLVAAVVAAGSLGLLTGAWALPWLVTAVLAAWWLTRLGRRLPALTPAPVRRETWREFWSFTWPRSISSVVQLALQRVDIVLIAVLIGPAQAAVYTAATRFLVVGQLSSTAVSTAAQPRLAELLAVHDRPAAKKVYQSATAWIVLLTWPLYLLSAVFADSLLSVFGSDYTGGSAVVLVLAGAMLVSTACGMVDMLLNMAGRTSWTLANSLVALVVMLTVDLLLIPRLGILGAAVGWAAAILANNGLPLVQLVRTLGLHPFGRATLAAAALATACFGVLPGAARLLFPGNVPAAVGATALGAALFVICCLRWRTALGLPRLSTFRPRTPRPSAPASPDAPTS
jgi:O-antigen/teichoic acid export membrane protein